MSHENQHIVDYYEQLYRQHGNSPLASDYGSEASQQTKFRVLGDAADFAGKRVLDVGCGLGRFSDYLEKRFGQLQYHGVDITPSVVESAAQQFANHTFECRNILSDPPNARYDIVTANGIFYLVRDQPWLFMQQMVEAMFSLCREAVAFNSLSTWADFTNDDEFYADPTQTLAFCQTLTRRVVLRHDYMGHDFTVFMYREPKLS